MLNTWALINLDHNAGGPLDPRVREALTTLLQREDLGNPSSLHRAGQAARAVVEHARRRVAAAVGAEPLEVTFTSGGTEADALAILGIGRARQRAGLPAGVLSAPIEHPAVLGAIQRLAAEGHPVVMVELDRSGRIRPEAVEDALRGRDDIGLVSLAAANHELGNAYDLPGLSAIAREHAPGVVVHTDAVQALGRIPVDRRAWGVDLLSLSAHKIGGPRGIGALVHDKALALDPLVGAGHHERGRRPGTEALLAIHGFGVAAELAEGARVQTQRRLVRLHARLIAGLSALGGTCFGDGEHHVGNTITVSFPDCEGHLVMIGLDLEGIAVSTGAACDAGSAEPSAVLRALGHLDAAHGSIRISMGRPTTEADVERLLSALPPILARVREARAS